MEFTLKEWLMVLAMVDRLHADNMLLAGHMDRLTGLLSAKGVLSQQEKAELDRAVRVQKEASRQTRSAENEPGNPAGSPFYRPLSQELRALGVHSDNPTIGDTLPESFEEILQKVLERFRRNREDGDAGRTMKI
jgi:hypothetical protein